MLRKRKSDVLRLAPRIVVNPRIHSGKPVIEGTRVPVDVLVGAVASGMAIERVADEYGVTRKDVLAAIGYSQDTKTRKGSRTPYRSDASSSPVISESRISGGSLPAPNSASFSCDLRACWRLTR